MADVAFLVEALPHCGLVAAGVLVQEVIAVDVGDFGGGYAPLIEDAFDKVVILHLHLIQELLTFVSFLLLQNAFVVVLLLTGLSWSAATLRQLLLLVVFVEVEAVKGALGLVGGGRGVLAQQVDVQHGGVDAHVLAGHEARVEVVVEIE